MNRSAVATPLDNILSPLLFFVPQDHSPESESCMRIDPQSLDDFITALFRQVGCGERESRVIGQHLVESNLVGHDSHGVIRAPIYVRWVEEGKVVPGQKIDPIAESPTHTIVNGKLGFGQWIAHQSLEVAIGKCQAHGVAITTICNSGHMGRIGHWSEMAARQGLIAIHVANSSGLGMHCLPAGGRDKRLSVNPISIAVPRAGHPPLSYDIAAAETAEGKVKVARNQGKSVPAGWITDRDGNPTTNPHDFYDRETGKVVGAIEPLAGHKGYGLSFMIELLAGALSGNGASRPDKTQMEQGLFSVLISPQAFDAVGDFASEVERYIAFVKSARPRQQGGEVLVPGEIESRNRVDRTSNGIELDDATWQQLVATAQQLDVPYPAALTD